MGGPHTQLPGLLVQTWSQWVWPGLTATGSEWLELDQVILVRIGVPLPCPFPVHVPSDKLKPAMDVPHDGIGLALHNDIAFKKQRGRARSFHCVSIEPLRALGYCPVLCYWWGFHENVVRNQHSCIAHATSVQAPYFPRRDAARLDRKRSTSSSTGRGCCHGFRVYLITEMIT